MSIATTTRSSSRDPWRSHSPLAMPSTTPHGLQSHSPGSVGQAIPPRRSTKARSPRPSPRPSQDLPSSSPNYFGFVSDPSVNPMDSNAGEYVKKNWNATPATTHQHGGMSPNTYPADSHPKFEAFRRQSQSGTFSLGHGNLSHFSLGPNAEQSPTAENQRYEREGSKVQSPRLSSHAEPSEEQGQDDMDMDLPAPTVEKSPEDEPPSFFDLPRNRSPSGTPSLDLSKMQRDRARYIDEGHRPNSLPPNPVNSPSPGPLQHIIQRAETLPSSLTGDGPNIISPQNFVDIIKSRVDMLLLDLRVFPQFSQSRIKGAINLCIPTTLLKRPSFNVQKLAETFTKETEKEKFSQWREAQIIAVYDASSVQLKDATSSVNTLKKFTSENWHGTTVIIRGGFLGFSKNFPELIDKRTASEIEGPSSRKLTLDPHVPVAAPVAGGCVMPAAQTAANPFFNNIRQNMDLIGGVGQMAIKLPSAVRSSDLADLPLWLTQITNETDNGKTVADHFLAIEKAEQERMQCALSGNVSYGTPKPSSAQSIQIAGLEKGVKNRYKDMLPYDHSRVRLQNVPEGDCDYVNASHVKSKWSNRRYVATQAPVPATFHDFWRLTWEQDARVIVMLTAESDGGQRKCHPYWVPEEYGSFKLKSLSERRLSLEVPKRVSTDGFMSSKQNSGTKRPSHDRRRSTNNSNFGPKDSFRSPTPASTTDSASPYVTVRKLALSNTAHPFEPMREITQLQYSSWPDFGAPAHPAHVLSLVEHCGAVIRSYDSTKGDGVRGANIPANEGERPLIVHCSAGCGRTGTFCTIDSVLDMLKQQRLWHLKGEKNGKPYANDSATNMDVDDGEHDDSQSWISRDDVDLIVRTVEDFRLQRLSMVQTLRQFVLCYETVLEWVVREMIAERSSTATAEVSRT